MGQGAATALLLWQHRLGGHAFDYVANPVRILIGRLLIMTLVGPMMFLNSGAMGVNGILISFGLAALLSLIMPWAMVQSRRFQARYSLYRGLHFGFAGKAGQAYELYLFWGLLVVFTLGALYPLWRNKRNALMFGEMRYASLKAGYHAKHRSFYGVYLFYGVLLGLLSFILVSAVVIGGALFVGFDLPEMMANPGPASVYGRLISAALSVTVSLALAAMIHSAILNVVWNNLTLGPHAFASRLKPWRMAWITISNLFVSLISLGLLAPWGQIRMARYRAACLTLLASGALEATVSEQARQVASIGEEVGDILDVDLGF
ncbi:putative innner membrane protein [Magnetofaba australis IT-1]|uniref:Putative innner membrane protein n=1 Tax=Magnetofaba australis IT-1 TaxID=1434232 RepID=A0A1Y2JZT7_9PROT|nr:putative innner membrane protein [Magnetofaba australis IT-1]